MVAFQARPRRVRGKHCNWSATASGWRLDRSAAALSIGGPMGHPRAQCPLADAAMAETQRNVFGEPIEVCSLKPMTGFYRSGCCETGPEDVGVHTVCIE